MPNHLLVIHGWSDSYASFAPLREFLAPYGYRAEDVFLGNYESMHDDVTFDDLAEGLDARLRELVHGRLRELKGAGALPLKPFSLDVIVHSTGGPVVRHWLTKYVERVGKGDPACCPVRSLVMLAPANFGSRLAAQGKSALAKLFRGGVEHGFETGRRILEGLELGSPFLWNLAERDLFRTAALYPSVPDRGPFLFVFSGTATYGELKGLVAHGAAENGSDGTIRAAAASLDSIKLHADFTDPGNPLVTACRQPNRPIAFKLVPDLNHSEIVPDERDHPVLALIDRCLKVTSTAQYDELAAKFGEQNKTFYGLQPKDGGVRRRQQFMVRVRDDLENDVEDYRLEFHVIDGSVKTSTWTGEPPPGLARYLKYTAWLQEKVICDVQPHTVNPAYRTFFVDLDALDELQAALDADASGPYIALNLDALPAARGVSYRTDGLQYVSLGKTFAANGEGATFFAPNTSTLVDIRLKLFPDESVFCFK